MVQFSETPRMKSVVGMISQERFVMKLRSSGFLARLVQSWSDVIVWVSTIRAKNIHNVAIWQGDREELGQLAMLMPAVQGKVEGVTRAVLSGRGRCSRGGEWPFQICSRPWEDDAGAFPDEEAV